MNGLALLKQTEMLLAQRERRRRETGADFNLFTILGRETDEVHTHSRLLYELLRTDGSHGMGDLFLREFFPLVLHRPFPEDAAVRIAREYKFENGQIDLLLEGRGFCFPIEVKINAEDQPLQMKRYGDFAAGRAEDSQAYYLTLDGHEPPEYSTGGKTDVICLSFAAEIRRWMERCGGLVHQIPAVSCAIQQYIDLLDRLAGRRKGDEYMDKIEKRIGTSREGYESALAVSNALVQAKTNMICKVFREIEAHIGSRLEKLYWDYEEPALRYYTARGGSVPYLAYLVRKQKGLSLTLEIGLNWKLYYGFLYYDADGEYRLEETQHMPRDIPNREWGRYLDTFEHRDGEMWIKLLPSLENPLNFKECGGIYPQLYDWDEHTAILHSIYAELDSCLAKLGELGLI